MASISIIITCYNRARQVAQAIESVLNQTYSDFKLIIWDDGSSDRSLEIAKSYLSIDSRAEVVRGIHSGASYALKKAIALSFDRKTSRKPLTFSYGDKAIGNFSCLEYVIIHT